VSQAAGSGKEPGVAKVYRCDIDPGRHNRADGVHKIRVKLSEGTACKEPEEQEFQRKWPCGDLDMHPSTDQWAEVGSKVGSDDNEIHLVTAPADEFGAHPLHPAMVVNVVRNQGHHWNRLGRAAGSKQL